MNKSPGLSSVLRSVWPPPIAASALGTTLLMALALAAMGRTFWCGCASWSPWSWDIWTEHNSQHLLDPYTFTHVLHGILAYGLLVVFFRGRLPGLCALPAVAGEAVWEIAENTDQVIESYRETTIALNYYGDSILNSVADVAAFALGYTAAAWLPVWTSAAGFVAVETLLLITIRDNLILNVLMLLYPIEVIKTWQMGG